MDYGHQYNNFSSFLTSSSQNLVAILAEGILTAIVTLEVFLRLIITRKVRNYQLDILILKRPFSKACGILSILWQ